MTGPADPTVVFPIEKPERRQKNGHPLRCGCRSCIGRRNRRQGLRAQRRAAKQAGIESRRWGDMGNEESFTRTGLGELFALEMKSGQVPKFFERAIDQANLARAIGDPRSPACVVTPKGQTRSIFVCYTEDLLGVIQAHAVDARASLRRKLHQAAQNILEVEKKL